MADDGFNRISAFLSLSLCFCDTAFGPGQDNLCFSVLNFMPAIAEIDLHLLWLNLCERGDLLQNAFQTMPIMRLAVQCQSADDEVAFGGRGVACLATKFVFFVRFSLSNALNFWRVPGINFLFSRWVERLIKGGLSFIKRLFKGWR